MRDHYSETILALDTGSPVTSVAVGRGGSVLAERTDSTRGSSATLLRMIDEALREAGLDLERIDLLVALQGPGSFTGLRIGLATLLGLHQAVGTAATAVPTFEALALAGHSEGKIAALVDALRGEWFVQTFRSKAPAVPVGPAAILRPAEIAELQPDTVIGFGAESLAEAADWQPRPRFLEPRNLAPSIIRLAALRPVEIEPSRLTAPLYLRSPAATAPSSA